jgi:class 3 adenylate cyclase
LLDPLVLGTDSQQHLPMRDVEVRYAVRGDVSLAFEVFGSGPSDIVIVKDLFPIDLMWELPQLAQFMEHLGSFARVICFDDRGSGASDPTPSTKEARIEMFCDDLVALLDAADADAVTIFDMSQGTTGVVFAAMHPERVRSVISVNLRGSFPELRRLTPDARLQLCRTLHSTAMLRVENPRMAHDPVLQQWWGRARRLQGSPQETARLIEIAGQMDIEDILPTVPVPTLVLHRRDNRIWDVETSRAAAAKIPNVRFVEIPGSENAIFLGDTAPVLAAIEQFVHEKPSGPADERHLATVLFTDLVRSTEQLAALGDTRWRQLLDLHDQLVERELNAHRGRIIKNLGDGVLATFDGPARAVGCTMAIRASLAAHNMIMRAGLHTGEVEDRADDLTGIAVHIASRIAALAAGDEILVSRTLVDLTAGSDITFESRGERALKGVPDRWHVYGVAG